MFFEDLASPFNSVTEMNILQERLNRLVSNMQEGRKIEFPPYQYMGLREKHCSCSGGTWHRSSRYRSSNLQPNNDVKDEARIG